MSTMKQLLKQHTGEEKEKLKISENHANDGDTVIGIL